MNMTERARNLRQRSTDAEKALWQRLRNRQLGYKFRRQVPIGRYIADFLCFEKKLVIEADGYHHRNNPNDAVRDAWFEAQGYRVLRFWNSEILENTEGVLEVIRRALEES